MEVNRALIAGPVVVMLWASAFPAIRVPAHAMGVIGLSFARLLVAALALLVLAVIAKTRLPRTRDLGSILVCGFFGMTAYQLPETSSSSSAGPPSRCAGSSCSGGPIDDVPWPGARRPSELNGADHDACGYRSH